jgi:hypothetical protein
MIAIRCALWINIACLSLPAIADGFAHRLLGQCYATVEKFNLAQFGVANADYIKVTLTAYAGRPTIWIVDQTASTNYQWFLLAGEPGAYCLKLYSPAAILISPAFWSGTGFPEQFKTSIAVEPGQPSRIAIFKLQLRGGVFRPETCTIGAIKVHCDKLLN